MPKINLSDYEIEEEEPQVRKVKMNANKKVKKMRQ